jgi:prevent-host-death family protein
VRALELSEATGSLSEYARRARRETLVLTRNGRAVAAVVPLDEDDYFSMRLASDPEFIAIIERGRAQYKAQGGVSLAEMRRKYGIDPKAKRKRSRKAG